MPDLEQRISAIEQRNKRVELDKTWVTSSFRRDLLILFTYLAVSVYWASY